MSHLTKRVVVLDACILYSAPIRDFLLNLADIGLYSPKWTNEIQQEWKKNLLQNRPDLTAAQLGRTIDAMNSAFPESNVKYYEGLITSFELPDTGDRHVLAAAIKCEADALVTFNLKDFPKTYITKFGLFVKHPDEFIMDLLIESPKLTVKAFWQQLKTLKNPPLTSSQLLETFDKVGLKETSAELRKLV